MQHDFRHRVAKFATPSIFLSGRLFWDKSNQGLFWLPHSGSNAKECAWNAGDSGWEDSLEKGMATHSSILAWRIPWTEEPGVQSMGSKGVGQDWATNTFTLFTDWIIWRRACSLSCFFKQTFCLPNICSFITTWILSPLKPQTPIPNNLFCLWLKTELKVRAPGKLAS